MSPTLFDELLSNVKEAVKLLKRKKQKRAEYQRHKESYKARARAWAIANPKRRREIEDKYKATNPEQVAYNTHKQNAKRREHEFNLTFKEWIDWWGEDFEKRGPNAHDLCMCRVGDEGAYELGNIYKATRSQNGTDGNTKRWSQ